jgi:hypothetical protein
MTDSPYRPPGTIDDGPDIFGDIRGMQVITAALTMGVLTFPGFAVGMNGGRFATQPEFMFWFGLGFAGLVFVVHLVAPAVMRRQQMSQLDLEAIRSSDISVHMQRLLPHLQGNTHYCLCTFGRGRLLQPGVLSGRRVRQKHWYCFVSGHVDRRTFPNNSTSPVVGDNSC